MLLEVKDLRVYFPTRHGVVKAVDGLSYHLAEGEILGIVGESGSGKSVSALSLLQLGGTARGEIVSGEVLFQGLDLLKLSNEDMQNIRGKAISMVFQEPMSSLNPVLTIGHQLGEMLHRHLNLNKRETTERSVELLEQVGIQDAAGKLNSYPHQLSGGMCQRVMIALAMSCHPEIIIADEPTSALDMTTQAEIVETMKLLTREMGMSVIFITHNLGLVARYVERVVVMYAGRIMEMAGVKELFDKPAHPYTEGLLRSVPRLEDDVRGKLVPIKGSPPNPLDMPAGCSFSPRCPRASERCLNDVPDLISVSEGHLVACWSNGAGK